MGTTGTPPSGVLLSAYKNPTDGTVAVVAINNNTDLDLGVVLHLGHGPLLRHALVPFHSDFDRLPEAG